MAKLLFAPLQIYILDHGGKCGSIISKVDDIDEPSKTIFLACEEVMELAMDAAKRGIKTFSSEWLMTCVMRQEVDLEAPPFAESL